MRQNTSYLEVYMFYVEGSVYTHHGRHNPADVDGVASLQVVHFSVLLVLGADLEQIQAGLQNIRLILHREEKENRDLII